MAASKMSDAEYYGRLGGAECVSIMYSGNMKNAADDVCKLLEDAKMSDRSLVVVKPVRTIKKLIEFVVDRSEFEVSKMRLVTHFIYCSWKDEFFSQYGILTESEHGEPGHNRILMGHGRLPQVAEEDTLQKSRLLLQVANAVAFTATGYYTLDEPQPMSVQRAFVDLPEPIWWPIDIHYGWREVRKLKRVPLLRILIRFFYLFNQRAKLPLQNRKVSEEVSNLGSSIGPGCIDYPVRDKIIE